MAGAISQLRESCQFPFVLDEKPTVVPGGSAGERSGDARNLLYLAARSNSERAAPSACVGRPLSAPQIVWNRSTRRAGERGGARVGRPRWLRILTIRRPRRHRAPPQVRPLPRLSHRRTSSARRSRVPGQGSRHHPLPQLREVGWRARVPDRPRWVGRWQALWPAVHLPPLPARRDRARFRGGRARRWERRGQGVDRVLT
jgi:hypothetical protein